MSARANPWLLRAPALAVYAPFLVVPMALGLLIRFFDFQVKVACMPP